VSERPVRPRVTLGAVLALATALVAMADAVALPLALLLAGAAQADRRVRTWAGVALVATAGWIAWTGAADPVSLLSHVSAVVGGALFVLLMRSGPRPALESALLATAAAVAVGATLASGLGLDLRSTRLDLIHESFPKDEASLAALSAAGLPESVLLVIFDATFVLALVAGQCVAWHWYRLLAAPADLPAPVPFREFRFSDHLIWLFLLGLLGVTAQMMGALPAEASWPGTLLMVMAILYALRGVAVLWPSSGPLPAPLLLLMVAGVLFLMKFVFPGLLGLGVADTWFDFRRRAAAASGE
jgi:hypothetical protein